MIFNRAISDWEQLATERYLLNQYNGKYSVTLQGDSILASNTHNPLMQNRLHNVVKTLLTNAANFEFCNYAYDGATINQITTQFDNNPNDSVLNYMIRKGIPFANNVLIYGTARNDMAVDGITAAQVYVRLQAFYKLAKGYGFQKVLYCTPIADGNSSVHADNVALRNLIYNGSPIGDICDDYIDFGGTTHFINQSDASNTTYYQNDATHPTTTGWALLAQTIANKLNTLS